MIDLIERTRSFRRFEQDKAIDLTLLKELVNLARLGGSARNCQPWQYAIYTDSVDCEKIFPYLGWAGYLSDWKGPEPGERPGAMEKGIGGCRIGAFSPKLADIFKLEQHQELSLVVALGYPAEQVVIETSRDGDIKYWRDENELHHVPKRELSEILTIVEFK